MENIKKERDKFVHDSFLMMMLSNSNNDNLNERRDKLAKAIEDQNTILFSMERRDIITKSFRSSKIDKRIKKLSKFVIKNKKKRDLERKLKKHNSLLMMDNVLQYSILGKFKLQQSMFNNTNSSIPLIKFSKKLVCVSSK